MIGSREENRSTALTTIPRLILFINNLYNQDHNTKSNLVTVVTTEMSDSIKETCF